MALVVTLALLVLMTFAAVAFFTKATSHRAIEQVRTHQILANQVATSGLDYVLELFLQEMEAGSTNVGTPEQLRFLPTAPANMIPLRRLATVAMESSGNFPNLVRQSAPRSDPAASSDSTAEGGERVFNEANWNAPSLNLNAGFTSEAELPCWIYLQKDGTSRTTPDQNTIGRFAYNVYNLGGLLDVNAAGRKNLSTDHLRRIKSSPAGADLTALGISQSAVDNLVDDRSPDTGTTAEDIQNFVRTAQRSGFRQFVMEDTSGNSLSNRLFVSRKDLLRYARTQNPGILPALPYLTHFSLTSTAPGSFPAQNASQIDPTYGVDSLNFLGEPRNFAYRDLASSASAINPFVPLESVGNSTFSRPDGTEARTGQSLVNRKFALSRLAGLGTNGVDGSSPSTMINGEMTPATVATVQRDFGLQWDNSADRWDYVGHTGTSLQNRIKRLDEVADENREPNFFEMLKAAILKGSVGLRGVNYASSSPSLIGLLNVRDGELDASDDLHILRIGANIIDAFDRDNFPTSITMDFLGVPTGVHGVEDLPYLYQTIISWAWKTTPNSPAPGQTTFNEAEIFAVPLLFNPHSPSSPASGPSAIRAVVLEGTLQDIQFTGSPNTLNTNANFVNGNGLRRNAVAHPITGSVDAAICPDPFRARPRGLPGRLSDTVPIMEPTAVSNQVKGFSLYRWDFSTTGNPVFNGTRDASSSPRLAGNPRLYFNNLIIALQYQRADGNWVTYDTLAGHEAHNFVSGIGSGPAGAGVNIDIGPNSVQADSDIDANSAFYVSKFDPRTRRHGLPLGWAINANVVASGGSTLPAITGNNWGIKRNEPFSSPAVAGFPAQLDSQLGLAPATDAETPIGLWPSGGKTPSATGSYTNVGDNDGVVRPADLHLASSLFTNITTLANMNLRPVILQRPFRSVAELGTVFRDNAWKSLNFFDARSADAALLDYFSVDEEPTLSAGRVNPNLASQEVLEAVLRNTFLDPDDSSADAFSNAQAEALAIALQSRLQTNPMASPSDLVRLFSEDAAVGATLGDLKNHREGVARALADVSQTRAWIFFIDLVAQSGRVAPGGSKFLVEGQTRRWFSASLDRFTAKVFALQTEPVSP